jgi:PKD repeat protein
VHTGSGLSLHRSASFGVPRARRLISAFLLFSGLLFLSLRTQAATLTLFDPQYGTCGDVSINGVVLPSPGDTITQVNWDWGDGVQQPSNFPATHEYLQNGTYTVKVTATSKAGETISASESAIIASVQAACSDDSRLIPATIALRDGITQATVQVSLRDATGAWVPLDAADVSFSSSSPLVQVDKSGTVTASGFGTATITAQPLKYPRAATAQVFAGALRVEPAILVLSVVGKQSGQVVLNAYNADGTPLNLSSRVVAWSGGNAVAAVDAHGTVTALEPNNTSVGSPEITARVDGIGSHNGSLVRVLPDPTPVTMDRMATNISPNIVFYIADKIAGFDQHQMFVVYDAARITDLAFQIERFGSGVNPNAGDIQYLVNDVAHDEATRPCGYNGNPVVLGSNLDTGASCLIEGSANGPAWGIYFHEMGHNFTLSSRRFTDFAFVGTNPTYVEGLATAMAMYAGRNLLAFSTLYGLPQNAIDTLQSSHLVWSHSGSTPSLDAYVAAGSNYQMITADVLDDMLMTLMDKYGYSFFRRFMSVFLPVDAPYPFQIQSQAQQATFFVAALSAAVGSDLRATFRGQWGFPIDDNYWASSYPLLAQYASHADTPAPASATNPVTTTVGVGGGHGSLLVSAPGACPWTATTSDGWLTITGGTSGCGSGVVGYSVTPNPTSSARTATIFVAGVSSTVTQAPSLRFVPITPCRSYDTRNTAPIQGGTARDFAISGTCGIPTTAAAYSLNVTVVPTGPLGYVTVWPTGESKPLVSTLNALDGRIKANAAIVPAGDNGAISVFAADTTDVVLDINGYFVPATDTSALEFFSVTPCRLVDTRRTVGPLNGPSMAGGETRDFPLLSSSCNIPPSAQAYALNFTVVPTSKLGYLTTWPVGQAKPLVSTLSDLTGTIVANAAIVPAGTGGDINVFVADPTDVVIDVNGYFAPANAGGQSLYTVAPCRVLDTRNTAGAFTGMLEPPVDVVASACGIANTAQAFVFNATVVPQGGLGYLTLWPDTETKPLVSTLDALDGAITSNMAIVPTVNSLIDAFASDTTQLVLDIFAYFAP